MAVRFDAAADRLLRTTNLPTGQFTVSFWVYLVSDLNAYSAFWYMGGDNYGGSYAYIGTNADGTTLINAAETAGTSLTTATWYYVAYAHQSGASQRGYTYLGTLTTLAAQDIQTGLNPSQPTTTRMEFGAVGTGNSDRGNIRIANIKIWSTQLSLAQVQAEQFSIRPSNFTNLVGWYPCFPGSGERARDYSGLGYNWTEGGTLTDEDPPPVSYGASVYVLPYVAGAGGIDGSGAVTLGTLTGASAATLDIAASAAQSMGTLTGAAVGELTITGSAAVTLGTLTGASADSGSVTGSAAVTLGALTSTSAATLSITGSGSATLSALTGSASGTIGASGSGAVTLGSLVAGRVSLRFFGGGNSSNVDKAYIPCNPADAINVGQADFTIEMWVRCAASLQDGTATAGANYSWIDSPIVFDRDLLGSNGSGGDFGISLTDGRVTFGIENSAGSQRTIMGTTDLRDDTWHHIAVTRARSTGNMAVYVDGAREASQTSGPSGDIHIASNSDTSTYNRYICIGGEKHAIDWPQGQFTGYIDELRISTTLRYSSTSYTVPVAPFTADANTVGLYHLNDAAGLTILDSSGNSNNGSFTVGGSSRGPQWAYISPLSGAVATLSITGATAATLGALTGASAAALAITASASVTLGAMTGVGSSANTGAALVTFGALTGAGAAELTIAATASVTLGILAGTSAGGQGNVGSGSVTLGALTGASTATLAIAASGSVDLVALTGAGAGQLAITATATITLDTVSGSSVGQLSITGSTASTLGALTGSASGTLSDGPTGSAAVTLGALTGVASGTLAITASAAQSMGALTSTSTATLSITSVGSATLGTLTGLSAGQAIVIIGIMQTVFTAKKPGFSFTAKKPTITFTE